LPYPDRGRPPRPRRYPPRPASRQHAAGETHVASRLNPQSRDSDAMVSEQRGTTGTLQPDPEGSEAPDGGTHPVAEAAKAAARQAEETGGLGRLGRPMDRRSPFFIGMAGAAGVAVTIGLVELAIRARSVLVLIGLALFIAAGLDPVVSWLTRRRVPRWAAVVIVLLGVFGVIGGVLSAAVPPVAAQAPELNAELPRHPQTLQSHNSPLGRPHLNYQREQHPYTL